MEVRPVDKEEVAREKGIYRVTIVGSVVNFLLLLFKFFAGIVGKNCNRHRMLSPLLIFT